MWGHFVGCWFREGFLMLGTIVFLIFRFRDQWWSVLSSLQHQGCVPSCGFMVSSLVSFLFNIPFTIRCPRHLGCNSLFFFSLTSCVMYNWNWALWWSVYPCSEIISIFQVNVCIIAIIWQIKTSIQSLKFVQWVILVTSGKVKFSDLLISVNVTQFK